MRNWGVVDRCRCQPMGDQELRTWSFSGHLLTQLTAPCSPSRKTLEGWGKEGQPLYFPTCPACTSCSGHCFLTP